MGAWRPPQWQNPSPAKVLITFPGLGNAPQFSSVTGSNVTLPPGQTIYAFDVELEIEHDQRLRRTEHPVQTGSSISDHAFLEPATLTVDVGMSDGMDAYFSPNTWQGSTSKSVSAYQTLLALQFSRIPLMVTTRLRTYQNMLIVNPLAKDTYKTAHGLRMRVEFGQVFMANVSQPTVSARSQDTNTTNLGNVNPQPPTAAQESQNNVTQAPDFTEMLQYNAVGAGDWSSVNTNNLSSLPAAK